MSKLKTLSEQSLQNEVIEVVAEIIKDWDLEFEQKISNETGLIGELEFESIDIVRLVVALEQHFECRGIPFEKLFMKDGEYISELRINEIATFLNENETTGDN